MTKFETIGTNYQYLAPTKEAAQKAFSYSCKCCCNKGMRIDCDSCAIAHANNLVIAYFDDAEKSKREVK